MKFNYQIIIEYLGVDLVGWQIQKKGKSVQGLVEKALSKTLNYKIRLIGSGRTDAGVNALGQSANFFVKDKIHNTLKVLSSVNFFLNKYNISILKLRKRKLNFHARFSAKKRVYEYVILNRFAKPAIDFNRSWFVKKKLDFNKMKKGIVYFQGTHNFSAFRSSSCSAKSPLRTIDSASIKRTRDKLIINFTSKSFLQKQVRSMVGCLKYVGENKWHPKKIKEVINSKKREYCAPPAPASGLYLKKIYY